MKHQRVSKKVRERISKEKRVAHRKSTTKKKPIEHYKQGFPLHKKPNNNIEYNKNKQAMRNTNEKFKRRSGKRH